MIEDHGQYAEPGTPLWEQRRQQLIAERVADVAEYGHTWAGVMGKPTWIFTIGLFPVHPELILLGGHTDVLANLGNLVIERIRDGEQFGHRDEIELVKEDEDGRFKLRVVAFDREPTDGEHGWFNQHPLAAVAPEQFAAIQLVWPGTKVADSDDPQAELYYPTAESPWNDQPVLGQIWWES